MPRTSRPHRRRPAFSLRLLPAVAAVLCATVAGAADDPDPLALESAPVADKPQAESPLRLMLEGALGRVEQRGLPSEIGRRASADLRYNRGSADGRWRFGFSDRLDYVRPVAPGARTTYNSLREAFVGWQTSDAATSVEVGRINLRNGPAFGYNPTDYFRTGALRVVTTADPVALRETRMGTFMARAAQQWGGGSVSLAVAPRLDRTPDDGSFALDDGSTNSRHRALATASFKLSERVSGQALLLAEESESPRLGLSGTALVTDGLVVFGEVSSGRARSVLDQVLATPPGNERRYEQASLGFTYALPSKLSLTLEAEYNGGGLRREDWGAVLAAGPVAYGRYLSLTQRSQELGPRRAWLVYATQKDLGIKQLDLTALMRWNAVDDSRLAWVELRYRWTQFDLAVQWQRASGKAATEFGTLPVREITQLVGSFYF